ncbi:PIR Superfamily Protein [Plasmodium ovale wallikeri]|uniref:PIR Superfamily Protein n=1 Tax=Plasmodium ovale wallikeri TaxID=864142 RepID=A0A1A9AR81_PLAOA|nr:PIR Superfamily Protein [Plasmodium ovale wallikeri]SBT58634.1 PIR Superfamily Protein [Plasmodium ovale wallikeri]
MVSGQQDGKVHFHFLLNYFSFEEYNHYKSKLNDSCTFMDDEGEYEAFFKTEIPEGTENQEEIMNNCYILKKYLLNFISDESCNYGKCCSYVNYWLNEKIRKNKISLVKSDFEVYNNYIAYYNSRNNPKVCDSNEIFISNDIYEEMKILHTLYELYNTFKINGANIDTGCRELKTCVMHYNNIVRKCKQRNNTDFCKALRNFKTIFAPNKFISLSKCENKLGELKLKEPQDIPEEVTQHESLLLWQLGQGSGIRRSLGDSPFSQARENSEGEEESIHSSFFPLNPVIQTLFFSAVGISLLFLLSYKFTPFGKWMRSLLLKKNIIKHYETEETQDILSHTYENANIDTEDSVHNIQYYATQNS